MIAKVALCPPLRSLRFFNSLFFYETLAFRERKCLSSMAAVDDEQYGFKRQEMYSGSLAGSVSPYDRHVFLCYKSPDAWLSRVENEGLPKLFASSFKARKADISVETKLTICGGGESDGDVLIFPEMVRYKGLKDTDVDAFIEDVLVNGKPWGSGFQEELTGSYVFVCAHGSRDKRCGVCGPALIEKFKEEADSHGLSGQIFVEPCSHVGGHKYAGNLIIFSSDSARNVSGHWYGYVTPDDVPELLDQHIAKGEIVQRIWRGQMGRPAGETAKGEEQNLANGNSIEGSNGLTGGCCQGVNGVSCCQGENPEPAKKKETCKPPGWFRSLEKDEVFLAAAVVGAVATVAVAYSFYRRSG
ncbi:PREDICTED: altered inheritance of mitochondria protein 32-like [Tarenaya hassleriana]|uniref:altered inheritance of mitochondria protein 32-like n=1 Tax=Tarenaya hassleriana TaxID=28532 RepID=UPI00053C5A66|nr:PREDICTED: altered inheritance of mitochondria protein 32-like [Tarenaya hassleriana]